MDTTTEQTQDLTALSEQKVLRAAMLAQEAREIGNNVPSQLLLQHLSAVAKRRAEVFNALPHDTFKCPHSS